MIRNAVRSLGKGLRYCVLALIFREKNINSQYDTETNNDEVVELNSIDEENAPNTDLRSDCKSRDTSNVRDNGHEQENDGEKEKRRKGGKDSIIVLKNKFRNQHFLESENEGVGERDVIDKDNGTKNSVKTYCKKNLDNIVLEVDANTASNVNTPRLIRKDSKLIIAPVTNSVEVEIQKAITESPFHKNPISKNHFVGNPFAPKALSLAELEKESEYKKWEFENACQDFSAVLNEDVLIKNKEIITYDSLRSGDGIINKEIPRLVQPSLQTSQYNPTSDLSKTYKQHQNGSQASKACSEVQDKKIQEERHMRSLHWTPIISHKRKDVQGVEGLCKSTQMSKTEIWKELKEINLDSCLKEFTDLFSFPLIDCKPKSFHRKTIKVLDIKRSLNISIICRSMHATIVDIEHAIYNMDTSVVSAECLDQICRLRATREELELIQEASEENIPLDYPEYFLLQLSFISSLPERVHCIVFQSNFNEEVLSISNKMNLIKQLCNFLRTNEDLKLLFAVILNLGNYMNGNNKQRGSAEGFNLDILGKLKDIKSNSRRTTLLHFIVRTYIKQRQKEETQCFPMSLPIPEPSHVERCSKEDFVVIRRKILDLNEKLNRCKNKASEVIYTSPADTLQPFKLKMERFIRNATQTIEKLDDQLNECLEIFIDTVHFYHFMTKSQNQVVLPAQFFEYWVDFCYDFKKIWRGEIGL